MRTRQFVVLGLFLAVLLSATRAWPVDEGQAGQPGAFLRMGVGARAMGMAGVGTACVDDATATYWNPAAMGFLDRPRLGAMYSLLSLGRVHQFVGYVQPLGLAGAIGVSWINLAVNDIDGRDGSGNPTARFSDAQSALAVSYAWGVGRVIYVGATAKYVTHTLAGSKATGFGVDAGAALFLFHYIKLGVVLQDVGTGFGWESGLKEDFPTVLRYGVALVSDYPGAVLTYERVRVHGVDAKDRRVGLEYWFRDAFAVRAGLGDRVPYALGAAFRIARGNFLLQADYAIEQDPLDKRLAHRFGLTLGF